jgi:hypothetical protein
MLTIFSHPPNREGLKFFSLLILVTRLKMDPNTLSASASRLVFHYAIGRWCLGMLLLPRSSPRVEIPRNKASALRGVI